MERKCLVCEFTGKTEWRRGLCSPCYGRALYRGTLNEVARPSKGNVTADGTASPFWKGADITYNSMHARIRRMSGSASGYACSEKCGNVAVHWSYDGYCPAEKFGNATGDAKPYCCHLNHYQPRCKPCHAAWDRDQDYVAEKVAA